MTTASHVPSLPRDFRLEQYEADGFSVLRSVFDSAYVATLRESWRSLASSIEHQGLKRQARFIFGVLPSPIGDIYKHPALVSLANLVLDDDDVALREQLSDRLDAETPALHHFVLAGGAPAGAALHVARAVCRRAERHIVSLQPAVDSVLLRYVNRLSDLLFVLARAVNHRTGFRETEW